MRAQILPPFALVASLLLVACSPPPVDPIAHRAAIDEWRAKRVARLTAEDGWLTLVGLYWFNEGENTFGRAPHNGLVLDHPQLPEVAGSFFLADGVVRFAARPDAGITADGQAATSLELATDRAGAPTMLAVGTLRFYTIERAGKFGLRVRDLAHPAREHFAGIEHYPVDPQWVRVTLFEPYDPPKQIPIVNVLGMVENMTSPGYVRFKKHGEWWQLDTVLENPDDDQLFIMFADGTSGRGTYGAGRFLYAPLPENGKVLVDFNRAYNPPCAFNQFATCPLPPSQNRMALKVDAGELDYRAGH